MSSLFSPSEKRWWGLVVTSCVPSYCRKQALALCHSWYLQQQATIFVQQFYQGTYCIAEQNHALAWHPTGCQITNRCSLACLQALLSASPWAKHDKDKLTSAAMLKLSYRVSHPELVVQRSNSCWCLCKYHCSLHLYKHCIVWMQCCAIKSELHSGIDPVAEKWSKLCSVAKGSIDITTCFGQATAYSPILEIPFFNLNWETKRINKCEHKDLIEQALIVIQLIVSHKHVCKCIAAPTIYPYPALQSQLSASLQSIFWYLQKDTGITHSLTQRKHQQKRIYLASCRFIAQDTLT